MFCHKPNITAVASNSAKRSRANLKRDDDMKGYTALHGHENRKRLTMLFFCDICLLRPPVCLEAHMRLQAHDTAPSYRHLQLPEVSAIDMACWMLVPVQYTNHSTMSEEDG